MKQAIAVALLLICCELTFAVDPVTVRALERDLAGQTPVFRAQPAKSSGRTGLIFTLAGAGMIGAGVYLAATSNQTVAHTVPVGGGTVIVYKTLYVEETNQGRRYGGVTMAGAGGVLVWQGLTRIH